jgi:hypothetical protein
LIKCRLNEGRYHASSCIVGKWLYVFGGCRTKKLVGQYYVQIDKKNEVVVNVTPDRIERYDTSTLLSNQQIKCKGLDPFKPSSSETENTEDEIKTVATLDTLESWPTFELISLKRDSIKYFGSLVTFPSLDGSKIYIFNGGANSDEPQSCGYLYDP